LRIKVIRLPRPLGKMVLAILSVFSRRAEGAG